MLLPDWKGLNLSDPTYLVINNEFTVERGPLPFQDRMYFWNGQSIHWTYTSDSLKQQWNFAKEDL